jgi:undecaprenyl diphosphate synthase
MGFLSTAVTLPPQLKHLAIIMDGNGRWAELRGRDRAFGHIRGAKIAKETIETCAELGLKQLTLYTFSTENWSRPLSEVSFLMLLLGRHLRKERANLVKNNIRFSVIGQIDRLPQAVREEIEKTITATKVCSGMNLTFALSYGGRQEIAEAARVLAREVAAGVLRPEDINEDALAERLQTRRMQDPDLILRTSGEYRLSNFMLWQAAYSELFVTETLWPDFNHETLNQAFKHFAGCERRFGKTTAQIKELSPRTEPITLVNAEKTLQAQSR